MLHLKPGRMSAAVFLTFCLTVPCLLPANTFGQDDRTGPNEEKTKAKNDPPLEKLNSYDTWEILVNIPGMILYFPFYILYSGVKPVITFIDKSNVPTTVIDFLTSDDGKRSAFPTYESRRGGGIKFSQKDFAGTGAALNMTSSLGLGWRRRLSLEYSGLDLGKRVKADIAAHYWFLANENFFGLGNDSRMEDEKDFGHLQTSLSTELAVPLGDRTHLQAHLGFAHNSISPGGDRGAVSIMELLPEQQALLPGLNDSIDLLSLGLQVEHDSRNRPGNPSAGWEILTNGKVFRQVGGNTHNFLKAGLNVTRYVHLFYDRVLVLRMAAELSHPSSSGTIPFYYLSKLGHRRSIRGFERGRFRDRDMVLFSFEYRYPLIKRPEGMLSLDAVLFVDWGKVSPDLSKEHLFKYYHRGIGGGLRLFSVKGLYVNIFVGKSRDGYRFYLVVNE